MSLSKILLVGVAVATLTGCFTYQEPPQWQPDLSKMAYSTDYKSTEVTQVDNSDIYDPLIPAQGGGRVRASNFYFAPGVDVTTTKVIALAYLPRGAVITGINVAFNRTNAASEMSIYPIAVSDGTSYAAYFTQSTSTASTTTAEHLINESPSQADATPSKLPSDSVVIAVVASADWGATSGTLSGTVFWVLD